MLKTKLQNLMDQLYNKILMDGVEKKQKSINWQLTKSGTVGFLSGINGFISFPISLPVHTMSILYIQLKMIMVIAEKNNYDLKQEEIKCLVYLCLCGEKALEIINHDQIEKLLTQNVSNEFISRMKDAIIINIIGHLSSDGMKKLVEMIPVAGGIMGLSLDLKNTKNVEKVANKVFTQFII